MYHSIYSVFLIISSNNYKTVSYSVHDEQLI